MGGGTCQVESAVMVEYLALLMGIRKIEELKLCNILLKVDAVNVCNFVGGISTIRWSLQAIVSNISSRRKSLNMCNIKFPFLGMA